MHGHKHRQSIFHSQQEAAVVYADENTSAVPGVEVVATAGRIEHVELGEETSPVAKLLQLIPTGELAVTQDDDGLLHLWLDGAEATGYSKAITEAMSDLVHVYVPDRFESGLWTLRPAGCHEGDLLQGFEYRSYAINSRLPLTAALPTFVRPNLRAYRMKHPFQTAPGSRTADQ